jgi:hypothetical protein
VFILPPSVCILPSSVCILPPSVCILPPSVCLLPLFVCILPDDSGCPPKRVRRFKKLCIYVYVYLYVYCTCKCFLFKISTAHPSLSRKEWKLRRIHLNNKNSSFSEKSCVQISVKKSAVLYKVLF